MIYLLSYIGVKCHVITSDGTLKAFIQIKEARSCQILSYTVMMRSLYPELLIMWWVYKVAIQIFFMNT